MNNEEKIEILKGFLKTMKMEGFSEEYIGECIAELHMAFYKMENDEKEVQGDE